MTKKHYRGSIKRRLTLMILLVTLITGIVGYSSFVYWNMKSQQTKTIELSRTVAKILSQDIAKLVLLKEIAVAADITSKLKSFDNIDSMILYKLDNKAIFQYNKNNKDLEVKPLPNDYKKVNDIKDNLLKLYADARYQGTKLGVVELNFKVKNLSDIVKRDIPILITISLVLLLLSFVLANFFAKRFTEPILKLVSFLSKIDIIDSLKNRAKTKEDNEIGKLYDEINYMLQRIENSQKVEKIAAAAFETRSGMMITDANEIILQVNKAFTKISGYEKEEVIGKTPSILRSGYQDENFYKEMKKKLHKYNHWSGEIYNKHKDGTIYPEHLTIQAVLDDDLNVIYYVASFIDLTIQKETEAKVEYLKQYDSLTGLANKEMLLNEIQTHLNKKQQFRWGLLICFDLRDFKIINDAYGYSIGDKVLEAITLKTKKIFNDASMIARVTGDEFAVWFPHIHEHKNQASIEAKLLAEFLVNTLSEEIKIEDKTINPMVYAGLSIYNKNCKGANELLKQADSALHQAKKEEKRFSYFDKQAQNMAQNHLDTYSQLIKAIDEEHFELFYQLQYDDENHVYGAEALIRWIHPEEGIIPPDSFIPIAEKTGLIIPIGSWVIKTACKQLETWQKAKETSNWVIAINISAKQFLEEDFIDTIKMYIKQYKVNANLLKVELTESILAKSLEEVKDKMLKIKKLGVQVSLDDFGTGYSSLQYLRELPLNQIKIDRSFVSNILENKADEAIVKSILLFAEALNLQVVAEGVETKEQYKFLVNLGCKLFQGYYFAKPERIENISTNK
ncbi:diguanylate cyclase [Arcobacter sp. CECT 8983]|uniref:sensor domain-containing protein n=1 Tax=Arcobacter sp. CECT 8983 TaxID=2044508 RepID=UPI00100A941C|nr:bifunctional diguanylate cyclase/phosphodiesterase [Arcobacter sp. CECT 8983]RXJ91659.1 diguanylate cyclase [Arcobacter sp. CECT 8983]